jgi:putative transcriptional regulator
MIRAHLSRLLGEKKVRIADVARATGLSRKAITLLYQETGTRVEFETLDRLCSYLGCEIYDLLEYVPVPAKAPVEVSRSRPRKVAVKKTPK